MSFNSDETRQALSPQNVAKSPSPPPSRYSFEDDRHSLELPTIAIEGEPLLVDATMDPASEKHESVAVQVDSPLPIPRHVRALEHHYDSLSSSESIRNTRKAHVKKHRTLAQRMSPSQSPVIGGTQGASRPPRLKVKDRQKVRDALLSAGASPASSAPTSPDNSFASSSSEQSSPAFTNCSTSPVVTADPNYTTSPVSRSFSTSSRSGRNFFATHQPHPGRIWPSPPQEEILQHREPTPGSETIEALQRNVSDASSHLPRSHSGVPLLQETDFANSSPYRSKQAGSAMGAPYGPEALRGEGVPEMNSVPAIQHEKNKDPEIGGKPPAKSTANDIAHKLGHKLSAAVGGNDGNGSAKTETDKSLAAVRTEYKNRRRMSLAEHEHEELGSSSDQAATRRFDPRRPSHPPSLPKAVRFTFKDRIKSMANLFMYLLKSRHVNIFFNLLSVAVDLVACILYIVEVSTSNVVNSVHLNGETEQANIQAAHLERVSEIGGPAWLFTDRPYYVFITGVVIAGLNLLLFVISMMLVQRSNSFKFRIMLFIELLTIVPYIVALAIPNGRFLFIPYFLRSIILIQRVRLALNIRMDLTTGAVPFDPLLERLIVLVGFIITILYVGASVFQWTERSFGLQIPYDFFTSFYFTLITVSTVGYGDISPVSAPGQIGVLGLILVALIILPNLISGTLETIQQTRSGGGSYIRGSSEFIVICGNFDSLSRVNDILASFYNVELQGNLKVVFLGLNKPTPEVKALVSAPLYRNRVKYLQGSILAEKDLNRAQVFYSSGVFLMPDFDARNHQQEDERTTLRAWAIHRHAPHVPLYVYTILPETSQLHDFTTQSICLEAMKHALSGSNLMYPGAGTLLVNLLTNIIPSKFEVKWLEHYGDGTGNEIYSDHCPALFVGQPFSKVSWFLFHKHMVTLFAIQAQLYPHLEAFHVVLNPGADYLLKATDICIYITQSTEDLERVRQLNKIEYEVTGERQRELFECDIQFKFTPKRLTAEEEMYMRNMMVRESEREKRFFEETQQQRNGRNTPDGISRMGTPHSLRSTQATENGNSIGHNTDGIVSHVMSAVSGQQHERNLGHKNDDSESSSSVTVGGKGTRDVGKAPWNQQSADEILDSRVRGVPQSIQERFPAIHPKRTYVGYPDFPQIDRQVPMCHLALRPPLAVEDMIIPDSATGREVLCRKFILIVSQQFNLGAILCVLRAPHVPANEYRPVVILSPRRPTESEFNILAQFPDVFLVIGDHRKKRYLSRCNLKKAERVLILHHTLDDTESENFADSTTIMSYHFIQSILEAFNLDSYVSVELLDRANVQFLSRATETDEAGNGTFPLLLPFSPESGSTQFKQVLQSKALMRGSRIAQQRQRQRTSAKKIGVGKSISRPKREYDIVLHDSVYAAGQVLIGSMMDNILFQSFRQDCAFDVMMNLCGLRSGEELEIDDRLGLDCAYLCSIDIPPEFIGKQYWKLYQALALQRGIIPIGLFRHPNHNLGNSMPFVWTSPPPTISILEKDKVFVLQHPSDR